LVVFDLFFFDFWRLNTAQYLGVGTVLSGSGLKAITLTLRHIHCPKKLFLSQQRRNMLVGNFTDVEKSLGKE